MAKARKEGKKASKKVTAEATPRAGHDAPSSTESAAARREGDFPLEENRSRLKNSVFLKELRKLQFELVKWQYWIRNQGLRVVIVFEGRDAAGKGGLIKRITEPLNPRGLRLVALGTPSDVERTQWYFQRYVAHLPSAGEIVIFDRSWYNRAGVERVMGFCNDREYWEFLHSCPEFERMLVRSGIILVKYWLSVSDAEQEVRFQSRSKDPTRRWKLSPMDLKSREKWVEYSKAKDMMLQYTDIEEAPWYQLESDDKRLARLNGIRHLLGLIQYKNVIPGPIKLPERPAEDEHYVRPPRREDHIVPNYYAEKK